MTFPLGSLQEEGAPAPDERSRKGRKEPRADASADAAASLRLTGRLNRQTGASAVEPAVPIETTFRFQAWLLLGGVGLILMLLALLSHHPLDAAFTTSGQHLEPSNWVGGLGAMASDLSLSLIHI